MNPPVPEGVTRLPLRGPVFDANTDQVVYEFKMARKAAGIAGLRSTICAMKRPAAYSRGG